MSCEGAIASEHYLDITTLRRALERNHTVRSAQTRCSQPAKYRYVKAFADLPEGDTHMVAIVLFRQGDDGKPNPKNYIVVAYMRALG